MAGDQPDSPWRYETRALLYGSTRRVTTALMVMTANAIVVSRNTVSNGNFESTSCLLVRHSCLNKTTDLNRIISAARSSWINPARIDARSSGSRSVSCLARCRQADGPCVDPWRPPGRRPSPPQPNLQLWSAIFYHGDLLS